MFEDKKYLDAPAAANRMHQLLERFEDLSEPLRMRRERLLAALELQQFMLAMHAQVNWAEIVLVFMILCSYIHISTHVNRWGRKKKYRSK